MKKLCLAYNDCPVANVYVGYLGTVNNKWIITLDNDEKGQIQCYEIPEEYVQGLEKHFD